MTGLIWTIQLVHYPTFFHVSRDNFAAFEKFHSEKISLIVIPLMVSEIILAFLVMMKSDFGFARVISALIVVIIWITTFLLSVPCHNRLSLGWDEKAWGQLVKSNWLRTSLWSGRLILLTILSVQNGTV